MTPMMVFLSTSALLSGQAAGAAAGAAAAAVVPAVGDSSSTQQISSGTTVIFQNGAPAPGLPVGYTYNFVRQMPHSVH